MRRMVVLVAVLVVFGTVGSGSVLSAPEPGVAQTTPSSDLCDTTGVQQFADVNAGDYGAAYMWCMRALGLSTGVGDGAYRPDRDLNRAQMASFLVRLWRDVLGNQCPTGVTSPFTDVVAGTTHAPNIDCLYGLGITSGITPTTYSPERPLKASHITRFLYRLYNKAGNTTCGSSGTGSELARATACLLQLQVIPTQAEATANTPVTRAQMGVFLIGLWHNLAGRGLPPAPPQLNQPTIQPTTTTTQPTTTTTQPTEQPPVSRITLAFVEGSNHASWAVNADGTSPQQITTEGERPQWSPDGTKVVYTTGHPSFLLWVASADGTNPQQITTTAAENPQWSPDSTRVAYTTGHPSFLLWVVNPDGTNPQQITTTAAEYPQWSPDGTKIAYGSDGVWVANADGTNPRQLTADGTIPRWSPDGTRVSYTGPRAFLRWVVNADGTNRQLLSAEGVITRWSPDGTKLAYSHAGSVWVANADGTNPRQLTTAGAARNPQWSPDSARIVYEDNGVWIVNADGTNLKQLTINSARYQQWSPDSTKIAYFNNVDSVWIANADGTNLREIVNIQLIDQTNLFSVTYDFSNYLQWSPDSTKILFYIGLDAVKGEIP